MFKKLTHRQKSMVLWCAMLMLTCIAHQLSFRHAFLAIKLHHELAKAQAQVELQGASLPQVIATNNFYLNALKLYSVSPEDRENKLWQAISGMALTENVAINFIPNLQVAADTASNSKNLVSQYFLFRGNYFNLVKLLDTLSNSNSVGKIAELNLTTKKNEDQGTDSELIMKLKLIGF